MLADGKIYITNEDGVTSVVQAGPKFEVLAENDLGDYTLSSPAVSEGLLKFYISTPNTNFFLFFFFPMLRALGEPGEQRMALGLAGSLGGSRFPHACVVRTRHLLVLVRRGPATAVARV